MDSWRNRAFNKVLFRIMRQRLANCESTEEMRDLILSIDNYGPFIAAPKGMEITPTASPTCLAIGLICPRVAVIRLSFTSMVEGFAFTAQRSTTPS